MSQPPNYGTPPPPPPGGEPPYGGQPPYGAPGGTGEQPKNSVMAIIALVLGIIGVIPCFWGCFVFQIGAIVLGFLGKKEIADSHGGKKGDKMAQWGLILGVIGLVVSVVYWVLFLTTDLFSFDMYGDFQ